MNARLVAVTGPLAGRVFDLTALDTGEVTIGRKSGNALVIDDAAVSRQHCVLRRDGDSWTVMDRKSRSGTFVGDLPVEEHVLRDGDVLRIGDTTLRYVLSETMDDGVVLEHASMHETVVSRLRPEDSLYDPGGPAATELPATERTVRDLEALLRLARMLSQDLGEPERLVRSVLDLLLDVTPAERVAALLTGPDGETIASTLARCRSEESASPFSVSRTLVRGVLREGEALLCNDLLASGEGHDAIASIAERQVRAVLCVPLEASGRRLGVLYLESPEQSPAFDEGHLQLALAIAGMAAVGLHDARRVAWLLGENDRLRQDLGLEHDLVGDSPRMRSLYELIAKVAPRDTTVLIQGESGTGKELVARAIHHNGPRSKGAFVAINCAALPDTLLESELFGHEKGAFTGAVGRKKGRVELADGGTLFLDEIGELAPALQAKLLRVLQSKELERVGGTRPVPVDVRILAATNRDLEAEVAAERFRRDLYYRLNVVSVRVPALRERMEDLPALCSHFLGKHGAACGRPGLSLAPATLQCLRAHDWPGNVRELQNVIERAVVLSSGDVLLPEDLPEALAERGLPEAAEGAPGGFHQAVRNAKRRLVSDALDAAGGRPGEAARLLGVNRTYFHRLVKDLDLRTGGD